MHVAVLRLKDLRNYEHAELRPAEGTTLILGHNGSGKSSLLEAMGLFSTLSSPRASSLKMLVREGSADGGARLETVEGTAFEVRLHGGRTSMRVAGSGVAAKNFLGRFRSVLFTPEDLDLVRGEPALRRRALDALITQLRPSFRSIRREYDRALRQRNAAIRDGLEPEVRLYSEPLAAAAAQVLEARREVTAGLARAAGELYGELAERGTLELAYTDTSKDERCLNGPELAEHFRRAYADRVGVDLERGRTSVGPHRDDLEILLDGRPARWYASRGEQRSATLAFRLAELRLLPDAVLMLDDVLSELDPDRRRRVFEVTRGAQTIVTATDARTIPDGVGTSVWRVTEGDLCPEQMGP